MESSEYEALQKKLDEINSNIAKSYRDNFQWANSIFTKQMDLYQAFEDAKARTHFEPYYNRSARISPTYPEIFNKYGERMEVFFMSDREFPDCPNFKSSRYIIWDRYNYDLETHFYTHEEMFRTVGHSKRRFGLLTEPRSIKPQSYEKILANKDYVEEHFEAVFTFDEILLSSLKNAKLAFLASVWYRPSVEGLINPDENYKHKTKNISIICSAKNFCEGHAVRQNLAFKCKALPSVDTYGKFDGGEYVPIHLPFEKYRYSIAVENLVSPFYFTEKIMNCFAAQTIPIYLGATEIGRFFNPEGIIQITLDDVEHIEDVLEKCTVEEYERRLPAIIENYNLAKKSMQQTRFDDIYLKYIKPKS